MKIKIEWTSDMKIRSDPETFAKACPPRGRNSGAKRQGCEKADGYLGFLQEMEVVNLTFPPATDDRAFAAAGVIEVARTASVAYNPDIMFCVCCATAFSLPPFDPAITETNDGVLVLNGHIALVENSGLLNLGVKRGVCGRTRQDKEKLRQCRNDPD